MATGEAFDEPATIALTWEETVLMLPTTRRVLGVFIDVALVSCHGNSHYLFQTFELKGG
jgi:hypothetical protein